jgi:hypothetical protein
MMATGGDWRFTAIVVAIATISAIALLIVLAKL